jgi:AcrR family transcriptional regulator
MMAPVASSSTATVTRRRGPDRRREIVQVAYRQIADRGLEGLRFGDVARQAGINSGTLLYYFESKDALVQGVVAYLIEEFSEVHAPETPGDADHPLTQLRREFEDVRFRLRERPEVGVVYAELATRAQRDPQVAGLLRQLDDGWRGYLSGIIIRGKERGVFRESLDPTIATSALMAVIKGLGLQVITDPERRPVMDTVATELSGMLEAWLVC